MGRKAVYLSAEDREYVRRETKAQYWQRLDESNLTRNLRRKYLRLEAGLMVHTNNSLYDWAHELCRIAMQHLDDHDAGSKALIEASESPRKWWDKAKSIERQVEEQVGKELCLTISTDVMDGSNMPLSLL
ncbi:hypothetical protein BDZ89DRAFT_1052832 [Hymenopellis radicata]|nr:hypothetical protein BDZ89DRAFT_1052832 [Hymenopellis radicata]